MQKIMERENGDFLKMNPASATAEGIFFVEAQFCELRSSGFKFMRDSPPV